MKMHRNLFGLAAAVLFGVIAPASAAAQSLGEPVGRPVGRADGDPLYAPLCNLMYQDSNFRGPQFATLANYEWDNLGWFNDKMSSMVTYGGCRCIIYWDANRLGSQQDHDRQGMGDEAISWIGDQWNDRVSSIVCWG
jgi:hypothetical protein